VACCDWKTLTQLMTAEVDCIGMATEAHKDITKILHEKQHNKVIVLEEGCKLQKCLLVLQFWWLGRAFENLFIDVEGFLHPDF
jgi:hypothetical protein